MPLEVQVVVADAGVAGVAHVADDLSTLHGHPDLQVLGERRQVLVRVVGAVVDLEFSMRLVVGCTSFFVITPSSTV